MKLQKHKEKDIVFQNLIQYLANKCDTPLNIIHIIHNYLNITTNYLNIYNSTFYLLYLIGIKPMLHEAIMDVKEYFRDIFSDIRRGFDSTQVNRNYPPRYPVDRPRQPLTASNNYQLIKPDSILNKSQLYKKDFSKAVHPFTRNPIKVIPYKSIEFFKIVSLGDNESTQVYPVTPQFQELIHKYTYFNIKALDVNYVIPSIFLDWIRNPFYSYRALEYTPNNSYIRRYITGRYIYYFKNMRPELYEERGLKPSRLSRLMQRISIFYSKRYQYLMRPQFKVLNFLTSFNKKKPKISEIDAKIYKILKNQNLDPDCKPVILKALFQIKEYNVFRDVIQKKVIFSAGYHFRYRIVDKFPYIGSPLRHLAGNIKLIINDGLTYTFRLIGLKDNLTQLTVFTNNSYISLLHSINTNYHKESLWFLPNEFIEQSKYLIYKKPKLIIEYEKPKTMFGRRFLLKKHEDQEPLYTEGELGVVQQQKIVKNEKHDHIFLIEEYKHNPHYHGLYIIVGDDKPVQRFTQLSSYKDFMNPELRSLLQLDFGYMKIDYNNLLKENFFNRKFILNLNYKIDLDKSFSDSPKLELILDKNLWVLNKTRNYILSNFFKKSDYFFTPYGAFVKSSLRRYLSHTHKYKELISNSNILKQTYLRKENNFIYDQMQIEPIKASFILTKDTDKLMKLSASWVKMYRAREFAKNLNPNIYDQLNSYNIVGTIYAAPFKKLNPLEPLKFRSQYRYKMHKRSERWPSLYNSYFYPKFVWQPIQNRLSKIFEHYDLSRSYSKKHLDFFFFNRDINTNWTWTKKDEDLCFNVNYEPKLITSILPKHINSKRVNKKLLKETNALYSNIQKSMNNIIKKAINDLGYSFNKFDTNNRTSSSESTKVVKNNVYELTESTTPYSNIFKFINGYKTCKGFIILTDAFDIRVTDKDPRNVC